MFFDLTMTDSGSLLEELDNCAKSRMNQTMSRFSLQQLQQQFRITPSSNSNVIDLVMDRLRYESENYCIHLMKAIIKETGPNHQAQIREMIAYYLMGVVGVALCCLGLIGNLLSLIVLTRKTMRTSTYCYLAALGVCDLLFVACTLGLLINDLYRSSNGSDVQNSWSQNLGFFPYLFPYLHAAAFTLHVGSIWLTLAFTVDRYIMICHPFQAEPLCTVGRAQKVVAGLMLACVAFNIPKFFEYQTVTVYPTSDVDPVGMYLTELGGSSKTLPQPLGVAQVGIVITEFGRSKAFKVLYHSWFYIVFVVAVPFVTLAVLNSCLVHAVRLSKQRSKQISNVTETKRTDTTVMLIGVVVIFFICQVPALVSRTIWAFEENPQESFKRIPLFTLNEVANFLIILNASINILPYYFFGRRFRREFMQLFCRCLIKLDSDHHIFTWSLSRRESMPESHC